MTKKKKVVVVGGGTGTYTVLSGLRPFRDKLDLSVIVSMMDSGGSNRIIRDEFGLLPTSDIRQCIVALSDEKPGDLLRKLLAYRFNQGTGIAGMTFGNLFMLALTDIYGNQEVAIRKTCEFFDVVGNIVPVTYETTNLVATYDNGKQVLGEHYIDEPSTENLGRKIVDLSVFPQVEVNPQAIKTIKQADYIILGPGDLYTSILCNIVIDGVGELIKKAKAKKILVMNLMTRVGQTEAMTASDHVFEVEKYLGGPCLDFCIVNSDLAYPKEALALYKKVNTYPVEDDLAENKRMKVIHGSFFDNDIYEKAKGDRLVRSLIRHDPKKLAKALISLVY
jgi:uncharacterized cofD-like protein